MPEHRSCPEVDAALLRDLYEVQGLGLARVAELTGLAVRTLRRRMAEFGIQTRAVGRRATSLEPYRRADVQLTPQLLRRLSVTEGRSAGAIARHTGVSARTVATYLRAFDIPVRAPGGGATKYQIDPVELARLRNAGWTVARIAERYRCQDSTVARAIAKAGLPSRLDRYERRDC